MNNLQEIYDLVADRKRRHESLRNSTVWAQMEVTDNTADGNGARVQGYLITIDDDTRQLRHTRYAPQEEIARMLKEGIERWLA